MKFLFQCQKCREIYEVEGKIGTSPNPPRFGNLCECGGVITRRFTPLADHWYTSGVYKTDKALYPTGGDNDTDRYDK
jgi:hypothetical protein